MAATRSQPPHPGMLANGGRTPSSSSASAMYYPGGSGGGDTTMANEASLYSTCARVPLIKSPAVRVPPAVTLPPTLHPLPPNLHDYFVYPFSLEKMVLDAADRRERQRKEDLQRRAPGWSGGANDVLEPTKRAQAQAQQQAQQHAQTGMASDLLGGGDESANQVQSTPQNDIDEMARMMDELGRGR